ncbi:MAG: cysteine desulfurase [Burkholderiales bacterium]|nr:cysteine desulfurase [Burkholderiales bacterium]
MNDPVYLDYNATTPVAPEVLEAMLPYLREGFGNPSSSHHNGRKAAQAVREARESVADLLGAAADEIVFTGSATEANNLALLGVAHALRGDKRHLVVSAVEHPAVIEPALHLQSEGWDLSVIPVDAYGRVDPADVAAALRPNTALVSIMHANNEVGTIQPVAEIAAITKTRGILLHTDAAQSAGKIPLNVDVLGVDLLTLAGHKFYAPKGVGALYVRAGTPIAPIQFGAGQEHGLRPGTENVPQMVGLGAAARLARERLPAATEKLRSLRDKLHQRLMAGVPGLMLNGHSTNRLPTTLNVSFPGISGRELLSRVDGRVAASVGSACHSEADAVSGVLAAMGCDASRAVGAVRLSVGWMTTPEEIEAAAAALSEGVNGLLDRQS